jgi:hypothetical protein
MGSRKKATTQIARTASTAAIGHHQNAAATVSAHAIAMNGHPSRATLIGVHTLTGVLGKQCP